MFFKFSAADEAIMEELGSVAGIMMQRLHVSHENFIRTVADQEIQAVYRCWSECLLSLGRTNKKQFFTLLSVALQKAFPQSLSAYFLANGNPLSWQSAIFSASPTVTNSTKWSGYLFDTPLSSGFLETQARADMDNFRSHIAQEQPKAVEQKPVTENRSIVVIPVGWQAADLLGAIYIELTEPVSSKLLQTLNEPAQAYSLCAGQAQLLIDTLGKKFWDMVKFYEIDAPSLPGFQG